MHSAMHIYAIHSAMHSFLQGGGAELGQRFKWRDAWRQHSKCEQADLDFERACVRFNVAAAQCFLAERAREKGPQFGGLKQAVFHFQQAAAYFEGVRAMVKAAIWGLRPRCANCRLVPSEGDGRGCGRGGALEEPA